MAPPRRANVTTASASLAPKRSALRRPMVLHMPLGTLHPEPDAATYLLLERLYMLVGRLFRCADPSRPDT